MAWNISLADGERSKDQENQEVSQGGRKKITNSKRGFRLSSGSEAGSTHCDLGHLPEHVRRRTRPGRGGAGIWENYVERRAVSAFLRFLIAEGDDSSSRLSRIASASVVQRQPNSPATVADRARLHPASARADRATPRAVRSADYLANLSCHPVNRAPRDWPDKFEKNADQRRIFVTGSSTLASSLGRRASGAFIPRTQAARDGRPGKK